MNNKKTKTLAAITMLSFAGLGVGLGFGISYAKYSTQTHLDEKMQNSVSLSEFIQKIGQKDFFKKSDFDKAFSLIDQHGNKITNYSNLTVDEAFQNGYFRFDVPAKVKFYANKSGVEVFVKKYNENDQEQNIGIYPSSFNSSTPEFQIWFSKGSGENKVEDFIKISGAGFYGFKKTIEENDVRGAINLFTSSFTLNREFYSNYDKRQLLPGIFAKNIKSNDVVSNLNSEQINGVSWKITSLSQDNQIPSTLNLSIDFSKGTMGQNYFAQTYQKFQITNFDIDMGVDDYVSKVKNFIAEEKNKIGLGEAFKFAKKNPEDPIGTVVESYQAGLFTLNIPGSYKSKATNAGVEYIFKKWEDGTSDSAFPNQYDSTTPMFKIYIRAGAGTPFQYEEFFVIEGSGQVVDSPFKITSENQIINQINDLTVDPFAGKIDLALKGIFAGITPDQISANIVAGVEKPMDNIALTLQEIILPGVELGTNTFNIQMLEVALDPSGEKLSIKVEIFIGTEYQNKASIPRTITSIGNFMPKNTYDTNLITAFVDKIRVDSTSQNVSILTKNPITAANKEDVIRSIQAQNGFYFNDSMYVGYDEIMNNYKWSNKPVFQIDFSKTKMKTGNEIIEFHINIYVNNVIYPTPGGPLIIERTIDSFIKPIA